MRTLPGNTRLQGPPTLQSNCFAVGQCGSTTSRQCLSLLSWRLSGRQCRRHTCGSRIAYTADRTAAGSVTWRCRQPIEGPRPRQKCSVLVGGNNDIRTPRKYVFDVTSVRRHGVQLSESRDKVWIGDHGGWTGGGGGGLEKDGGGGSGRGSWMKERSERWEERGAKYNSMSIALVHFQRSSTSSCLQ